MSAKESIVSILILYTHVLYSAKILDCNLVQMDKYFVHVQPIRILMGVKGQNV